MELLHEGPLQGLRTFVQGAARKQNANSVSSNSDDEHSPSASPKVGALRIYNAAIPVCKEIIKVSRHGIYDVQRMTNEVYLLKLKNGQIMQFNIKTKKELFMTDVGHVAQI